MKKIKSRKLSKRRGKIGLNRRIRRKSRSRSRSRSDYLHLQSPPVPSQLITVYSP